MEITLNLPEHIYQRAARLAELTGKDVKQILSQTLGRSLPPLLSEIDDTPIEKLPDDVLSQRMNDLHDKQQAGILTDDERSELHMIMELYDAGQLRKTQALVEAIKRGLKESGEHI